MPNFSGTRLLTSGDTNSMHITEGVYVGKVIPGTISCDTDRISWGQSKGDALGKKRQ